MCGRIIQTPSAGQLAAIFAAEPGGLELAPHFNLAPSQQIVIVRQLGQRRVLGVAQWGFVRGQATGGPAGRLLFNARSETAAEKPAFRAALRSSRCIVPADGFYEWSHASGASRPYVIRRKDGQPLALAGLCETGRSEDGGLIERCTILTTAPNDVLRPLHGRMPVILEAAAYGAWLDPGMQDPARLVSLLRPSPAGELEASPVSTRVNSPKNDGPECLVPEIPEPSRQGSLF